MFVYLLAVAVVLIAVLLAVGAAMLLHLHGTALVLLVVLIIVAGLIAATVILVMHYREKKRKAANGETAGAGAGNSELDLMLNDANRKLRTSQQGAKSLDSLPLLYLLGEAGSAKTTLVLRSGLDPELIAGTAPREGDVTPTPLLNLWFTREAAILEAGAAVRQDASLLTRLVNRTRPRAYRSAFGTGAPARAAVVCASAETFLTADAATASLNSARATGAQLREISRLLGAALPVYVIVTKLDRVPHFADYVRNLSNEEARQVLGLTVPRSTASAGVYADQAGRELGTALDGLTYALGEFRVELLSRETDQANTGSLYEFPREMGKFRKNLSQYLVEICKPSQLSANPYLRGFYLTGVRAQMVEQMAAATPAQPIRAAQEDVGATRMFSIQQQRTAAPAPAMVTTRTPQWTFLPRLFPETILGDKSALSATQQTAPARVFRRALFATAAALCAIYLVLLTISYLNNSALEKRIMNAARALPTGAAANANSAAMPSLSDLQSLDQLRQAIVQLDGYSRNGPPWSYRFGLYQGDKLDARALRLYFDRFRPLLLNSTQMNFISYLRALPDSPATGADYTAAYNPLKAYLITTSNPEKSSPEILSPIFMQYWVNQRPVDPARQQLARQQVDFYASRLPIQNPYNITPDTAVRDHARSYLSKFGATPRIYQDMMTAAEKTSPGIDFNKKYPATLSLVSDPHLVRGAFTQSGFVFMQDAIAHPERYFKGETWVLGDQAGQSLDATSVGKEIGATYTIDYIREWHAFLTEARVGTCGGMKDAAARLNILAGPASPILALFFTVSHNTAVADPQIKTIFQPAQALVDPGAVDRYIGAGNTNYVTALLTLSGAVSQVAQNPQAATDPTAGAPIATASSAALLATGQTAQSFNVDPQTHTEARVRELMESPIKCAAGLAQGAGKGGANGGGAKICGAVGALLGKFPFAPGAATQATVDEVNGVLAPETGLIWTAYNANLKPLLMQQGAQYVPAPGAPLVVSPAFANYFTRLAHISAGLYPAGAKSPTFTFALHWVPSPGIQSGTFVVDGQRIPTGSAMQQFTWNAATAQHASVAYNSNENLQVTGPWALFDVVNRGHPTKSVTGLQLQYPLEFSGVPQTLPDGTKLVVHFDLSGPGAEWLGPNGLSGLRCVAPVVK